MGEMEDFLACKINHELANMTINISQPHIYTNMTQVFKKDMK